MSTSKTANFQLNQWSLDDPFLMEEFNEDNRKIEAAIISAQNTAAAGIQGARDFAASAAQNAISTAAANTAAVASHVKLMDVTTSYAAQQISLNLSEINLAAYAKITLAINYYFSGDTNISLSPCFKVYVPGSTCLNSSGDVVPNPELVKIGAYTSGADTQGTISCEITFPGAAGGSTGVRWLAARCICSVPPSYFMGYTLPITTSDKGFCLPAGVAFSSIQILGTTASCLIQPGTRIIIYGEKL